MKEYKWKEYWYLGFLGLIGIYRFPDIQGLFNAELSAWAWLDLLWFLWFDYFLPRRLGATELQETKSRIV